MKFQKSANPIFKYILIFILILLGLGGLAGGGIMLMDPSGAMIGLPSDMLKELPILNFILPGFFLVGVMGIAPLMIAFALWKRLSWAWSMAVGQGVVLVLWICLQILLWGAPAGIQILYLVWGFAIVAVCFLPGVKPK